MFRRILPIRKVANVYMILTFSCIVVLGAVGSLSGAEAASALPNRNGADEDFAAGRFEQAASKLEVWLFDHPGDGDARNRLGWCRYRLGDFKGRSRSSMGSWSAARPTSMPGSGAGTPACSPATARGPAPTSTPSSPPIPETPTQRADAPVGASRGRRASIPRRRRSGGAGQGSRARAFRLPRGARGRRALHARLRQRGEHRRGPAGEVPDGVPAGRHDLPALAGHDRGSRRQHGARLHDPSPGVLLGTRHAQPASLGAQAVARAGGVGGAAGRGRLL